MAFKVMLTVKEYSRLSGVSEKSIREFSKVEKFPVIKSGVKLLIQGEMGLVEYATQPPLDDDK